MPKQIFGQLNTDFKNSIRLQKKKETYEIRKKLLKQKRINTINGEKVFLL